MPEWPDILSGAGAWNGGGKDQSVEEKEKKRERASESHLL